jgi:hypothetical protein
MKKSVIFIDHDGVLTLSTQWGGRFKKKGFDSNPETPMDIRMDNFDPKAVKVLNEIIDLTGCELVVSSDWKKYGTLEQMKEMYITRGIKPPIDLTPNIKDCKNFVNDHEWMAMWELEHSRVVEIKNWLHDHPEVTHWVAVDDLNMGKDGSSWKLWGLDNFVHCKRPYNEGIKQSGLKEKILKFLE